MQDTPKRYLKTYTIEETGVADPIQGQIRDPKDLESFLRTIQDKGKTKFLLVILDQQGMSLGNTVIGVDVDPTEIHPKHIFGFTFLFKAARFIIVTTHTYDDPVPTTADISLFSRLEREADIMGLHFMDYIIVASDSYWSKSYADPVEYGHEQLRYFKHEGSDDREEERS